MNTQTDADSIERKAFERWILNLQILFLLIIELKTDQVNLPSTISEQEVFIQGCIAVLLLQSPLKTFLQHNLPVKNLKRKVKRMIQSVPNQDSNLKWLFGLELSDIGEKLEHLFYDQLLPLKDDILQDTVFLTALTFFTNLQNKMHKETDFMIISWERKLIISIELKRTIADEEVFKQLEKSHRIFEERLGDRLGSDWTYFPVISVEKDALLVNSLHYITKEVEINQWLTSIFNRFPPLQATSNSLNEVKDLLKILVFAVHVSKKDQVAPITSSTWVEYTSNAIENVSTIHNILFYSNQQMAIMNNDDPRYKRIIIHGPFGVGKSILLKQKAIQLNKQPGFNGKVLFLQETSASETIKPMLYHRLKVELEEQHGISVIEF
uniref:Uncharacterized protein n=1 Tax=Clytia hemisphaerica TaxID=252671 RepID=A0A7M5UEM6_9CNID